MRRSHPLKAYLDALGLSQEVLAREANVTQPTISRIVSWRGAGRKSAQRVWEATGRRVSLETILGIRPVRQAKKGAKGHARGV